MPRINLTKEAAALGVGVLDQVLEKIDLDQASSVQPFQNFTDWGRTALAGGSSLAYMNNMYTELAEPVMYASSSLAAKSVTRMVQEILNKPAGATAQRALAIRRTQFALPAGRAEAVRRMGADIAEETLITTL